VTIEISGLEFSHPVDEDGRTILTEDACAFLCMLVDQFSARRSDLLAARRAWQAKIDAGELPDFRPETKEIRDGDWKVGALPPELLDRRVEITGPVDRKMVINALNADVKVFRQMFWMAKLTFEMQFAGPFHTKTQNQEKNIICNRTRLFCLLGFVAFIWMKNISPGMEKIFQAALWISVSTFFTITKH